MPEAVERAAAGMAQLLIGQPLPVAETLLGEIGDRRRVGAGDLGRSRQAGADDRPRRLVGAAQIAGHPGRIARQLPREPGEHGGVGAVARHVLLAVDAAVMLHRRVPHPPEAGRRGGLSGAAGADRAGLERRYLALAGCCGEDARSSRRRHEQHHDLSDLLEKAENVAGVAADLPARKHCRRARPRRRSAAARRRRSTVRASPARSRRRSTAAASATAAARAAGRGAEPVGRAGAAGASSAARRAREAACAAISASPTWIGSPIAASAAARNPTLSTSARMPNVPCAAVAHDRELALAVPAAAEPVDRVGEPVLVKGAGQRQPGGDRSSAADADRQAEQPGDEIRHGAQRRRSRRRPAETPSRRRRPHPARPPPPRPATGSARRRRSRIRQTARAAHPCSGEELRGMPALRIADVPPACGPEARSATSAHAAALARRAAR